MNVSIPEPAPQAGASADGSVRMVPRISIQAFCDTEASMNTLNQAVTDRRMSRSHVAVQGGGLSAAIEYYRNSPTPNLIIVESVLERGPMLAQLETLAGVCDAGSKVIVVGHINDVTLYRDLIKQGVSDYVVSPFNALQIIDAVGMIYENPESGPLGRSVAFMGAKGGVGSSAVAHNVAWAISELIGEDSVVADLDLAFGTVGLDFNQDPPQGIADALNSPDRLDEVLLERLLAKCTDRLSLFAAPSTLEREYDVDKGSLEAIIDILRESVPSLIVDLPHVWTGWSRQVLMDADHIVITAAPDLANLRNAKNLFDVLRAQRPNDRAPLLVLNQVGMPKRPEISVKDFTDALQVEPSVIIQFDPQLFGTAANNGQMIAELPNGTKVADGFADLAKTITGRSEVKKEKKSALGGLSLGLLRKKA